MKAQLTFLLFIVLNAYGASLWGDRGILEGRIVDKQTQQALPGVNIQLTGTTLGTVTDQEGNYRIIAIKAGEYDLRVGIVGYKTLTLSGVLVYPDLRTRVDIELEPTAIELEPVEIRAVKPLIQKDLAGTAYSVGGLKLERLPISTFRDVMLLQPGTTVEGNVRGGKPNEVLFLVDGLPVQDVIGGGLAMDLPRSSIAGMTVYVSGFEAEYGNALSGIVNVITKGGSRSHELSVRAESDNFLPDRVNQQQDHAHEVEISAHGPLDLDRLSYFTANKFLMSDTRWRQDFSRFFASPVSRELSGFAKVEYQPFPTFQLGLQGMYSLRSWRDYEFSWRFNLDGLPKRERTSFRVAGVLNHTLSSNSFYTASAFVFMDDATIGSKDGLTLEPYQYDLFLRYVISGRKNWWADTRQRIYTFKAAFTQHIMNMHLLKGGFEINQHDLFSDLIKYEPRLTYFGKPIEEEPLLNYSNSYRYYPRSGSLYVQDKMELVRDGSNLSIGLRWDFLDPTASRPIVEYIPTNPNEFAQVITGTTRASFKSQLSPRFGFAGPVGPSTMMYFNYGHYFQFPLFEYLYAGTNPSQLRSGAKNVLAGNPDLEPEKTVAVELGLRHDVGFSTLISVNYFTKEFRNQIDAKTFIPFDSKFAGDFGFAGYVNHAEASAEGFELVLSREDGDWVTGSFSYTYMKTEGLSEYVNQSINYAQWGFPFATLPFALSWDQRHSLKLDASLILPFSLRANVVMLYNSPRPFTYYPTRDGFTPTDTTRLFLPNNERMSDVLTVNLKLTKDVFFGSHNEFRLTFFADFRNLLNRKNVRWMDSNGRIGGELGDPSAYYEPRRARVGVRLAF